MHYKNKMISPKSFQVGLCHHSFSTGGSEKQRQGKCLTKVIAKFATESEQSSLCCNFSVCGLSQKPAPSF